jgi:hypothetical protein
MLCFAHRLAGSKTENKKQDAAGSESVTSGFAYLQVFCFL